VRLADIMDEHIKLRPGDFKINEKLQKQFVEVTYTNKRQILCESMNAHDKHLLQRLTKPISPPPSLQRTALASSSYVCDYVCGERVVQMVPDTQRRRLGYTPL